MSGLIFVRFNDKLINLLIAVTGINYPLVGVIISDKEIWLLDILGASSTTWIKTSLDKLKDNLQVSSIMIKTLCENKDKNKLISSFNYVKENYKPNLSTVSLLFSGLNENRIDENKMDENKPQKDKRNQNIFLINLIIAKTCEIELNENDSKSYNLILESDLFNKPEIILQRSVNKLKTPSIRFRQLFENFLEKISINDDFYSEVLYNLKERRNITDLISLHFQLSSLIASLTNSTGKEENKDVKLNLKTLITTSNNLFIGSGLTPIELPKEGSYGIGFVINDTPVNLKLKLKNKSKNKKIVLSQLNANLENLEKDELEEVLIALDSFADSRFDNLRDEIVSKLCTL